jgi:hypothetical protein
MLYFSSYVNDNAEQLRNKFVSHQGKKKLSVTTDNEISEKEWGQFFTEIIQQIKNNTTKGVSDKIECDFSTTGRVERLLSTAVIMETYKHYFDYERVIPECGIQKIHLGGKLEDWEKLEKKLAALAEYDVDKKLKSYVEKVGPHLRQFAKLYGGTVDLEFWNKILDIKSTMGSGITR